MHDMKRRAAILHKKGENVVFIQFSSLELELYYHRYH